ncbi:MAG: hypothetical protein WDM88_03775 [Galbitalea sp.]
MIEPTRRLRLRWGSYGDRYVAGLLYIVAGLVILLSTNTYTIGFLLVGTVTHTVGWFVLPATGRRRLLAFWPSLLSAFFLLTGPQILFVMAAPLLGWLIVRERPVRSYLVLLFPIAVGIVLAYSFHTNHDEPLAFGIESATVVASAWLARFLAGTRRAPLPAAPGPTVAGPTVAGGETVTRAE